MNELFYSSREDRPEDERVLLLLLWLVGLVAEMDSRACSSAGLRVSMGDPTYCTMPSTRRHAMGIPLYPAVLYTAINISAKSGVHDKE